MVHLHDWIKLLALEDRWHIESRNASIILDVCCRPLLIVSQKIASCLAGIAILVEAETPRPFLDELLAMATYVSSSSTFPQVTALHHSQISKAQQNICHLLLWMAISRLHSAMVILTWNYAVCRCLPLQTLWLPFPRLYSFWDCAMLWWRWGHTNVQNSAPMSPLSKAWASMGIIVQAWTGLDTFEDAVLQTYRQLSNAEWVFTTRGARGSMLIHRQKWESHAGELSWQ